MNDERFTTLNHQITLIDTGLMGDEIAACYLIESDGETAIIETGNFQTTERILSLLALKNLSIEKVRYIIPTHVHLDHAGGASSLIDVLPNAQLVIHPRGAKHMIDPSALIKGATAVYGADKFNAMYASINPIPKDRIIIADDGKMLTFGKRSLLFRDTPGHASHHFCIWDALSRGWFTGDTFGVTYPSLSIPKKDASEFSHYILPTSSPVQFKPELMIKSIEMMMEYQPDYLYLTHYGRMNASRALADELCEQVNGYVALTTELRSAGLAVSVETIKPKMLQYCHQKAQEFGLHMNIEAFRKIIAMDLELNSQGLVVWYKRYCC